MSFTQPIVRWKLRDVTKLLSTETTPFKFDGLNWKLVAKTRVSETNKNHLEFYLQHLIPEDLVTVYGDENAARHIRWLDRRRAGMNLETQRVSEQFEREFGDQITSISYLVRINGPDPYQVVDIKSFQWKKETSVQLCSYALQGSERDIEAEIYISLEPVYSALLSEVSTNQESFSHNEQQFVEPHPDGLALMISSIVENPSTAMNQGDSKKMFKETIRLNENNSSSQFRIEDRSGCSNNQHHDMPTFDLPIMIDDQLLNEDSSDDSEDRTSCCMSDIANFQSMQDFFLKKEAELTMTSEFKETQRFFDEGDILKVKVTSPKTNSLSNSLLSHRDEKEFNVLGVKMYNSHNRRDSELTIPQEEFDHEVNRKIASINNVHIEVLASARGAIRMSNFPHNFRRKSRQQPTESGEKKLNSSQVKAKKQNLENVASAFSKTKNKVPQIHLLSNTNQTQDPKKSSVKSLLGKVTTAFKMK